MAEPCIDFSELRVASRQNARSLSRHRVEISITRTRLIKPRPSISDLVASPLQIPDQYKSPLKDKFSFPDSWLSAETKRRVSAP
jgi:hypothetical protein